MACCCAATSAEPPLTLLVVEIQYNGSPAPDAAYGRQKEARDSRPACRIMEGPSCLVARWSAKQLVAELCVLYLEVVQGPACFVLLSDLFVNRQLEGFILFLLRFKLRFFVLHAVGNILDSQQPALQQATHLVWNVQLSEILCWELQTPCKC